MSAHHAAARVLALACATCAAPLAAAEPARESKQGGFALVAGRAVSGGADEVAGGPYAATVSIAQPDAQPSVASGGNFSVSGGVIAPIPRPDAVFGDGFE